MCNDEGRVERIDECVLRWFGHMKKMEKDRIPKRVYAGSRSVGRPRKRWIDIVKECLKKKGLDIRQAKRMVYDRNEWQGFVRRNGRGMSP